MSKIMPTYQQYPFEIVDGQDCYLIDHHQQTYLDLTSGIGVCNLGYHNQKIQDQVTNQLNKIWHTSNLYPNSLTETVAEKLCPSNFKAFFCNSGTEDNEAALKLARLATQKQQIIAFDHSFHGRTLGSLSITGNEAIKKAYEPLIQPITFGTFNDFKSLELIDNHTAAVIIEVIQGEGGVNVAKQNWLNQLQAKCKMTKTLLIIDEVQTGMGRTVYQFGYQGFNLDPDIITCTKGLANGLPIGAMLAKDEIANHFYPGSHGNTFGGNKVVMSAANEVLNQLDQKLTITFQQKVQQMFKKIEAILTPLDQIESISGKGLMIGIHLIKTIDLNQLVEIIHSNHFLVLTARNNTLRLLPPIVIEPDDLINAILKIKAIIATF